MAAAATLYANFFEELVTVGSHGSENYMAAWAMAVFAPYMVIGCLAAAALAFLLASAGEQRREALERASYDMKEIDEQ